MDSKDIPDEFRFQPFAPTGGSSSIHDDHIIELILGPQVKIREDVVGEARWFEELYGRLKVLDPAQTWNAIVSLHELPPQYTPPLETRLIFAGIMKDSQTRRVGMVNMTGWHKRVTQLYILTMSSRNKMKFFDTLEEARAWILSDEKGA
jgi:hypothetical protein